MTGMFRMCRLLAFQPSLEPAAKLVQRRGSHVKYLYVLRKLYLVTFTDELSMAAGCWTASSGMAGRGRVTKVNLFYNGRGGRVQGCSCGVRPVDREVRDGAFPSDKESFSMDEDILAELTVPQ